MKASELKPGQFFECGEVRCHLPERPRRRLLWTGSRLGAICIDGCSYPRAEQSCTVELRTGWDDEPQSEQYRLLDENEVLLKGDEFSYDQQDWQPVGSIWIHTQGQFGTVANMREGCSVDFFVRRKVAPQPAPLQLVATDKDGCTVTNTPAPLQLREGAWYRRRDGKVVGPIQPTGFNSEWKWGVKHGATFTDDGKWDYNTGHYDLIAEVPPPVEPPTCEPFKAGDLVVPDSVVSQSKCGFSPLPLYSVSMPMVYVDELRSFHCSHFRHANAAEIAAYQNVSIDKQGDTQPPPDAVSDTEPVHRDNVTVETINGFYIGLQLWLDDPKYLGKFYAGKTNYEYLHHDGTVGGGAEYFDSFAEVKKLALAYGSQPDADKWWSELTDQAHNEATKPQPDADGWIEWNGGKCPVPEGTVIDVRFRDGYERLNSTTYTNSGACFWLDESNAADITHYRLVEQPRKYRTAILNPARMR